MSNESYWGELAQNLPGATADGLKAFFLEFGKIQDDFANGRITDLQVAQAGARLQTLALAMERTRAGVAASLAAAGTAFTPDQAKFDAYWGRLTADFKSAGGAWTDVDTVAATRSFGANAARVCGAVGLLINVSEVRDAVIAGSGEELSGALAGWAGGSLGAYAGALFGGLVVGAVGVTPVGWAAIGVVGISAGVVALISSTGASESGKWLFRQYTDFERQRSAEQRLHTLLTQVEQVYGAESATYIDMKAQLVDGATRLGRLDGTWMQGFTELNSSERADLTALLIGSTRGRTPDALRADLRTLFDFDWGSERLPVRDALIDLLSTVSRDLSLPYDTSRMSLSVSDGTIGVEVPEQLASESEVLRRAVEGLTEDADSYRLLGITPDQILIGRIGSTVSGSAGSDLIIGGNGNETLTGGGGLDYLVGGAGADTLDAGSGGGVLLGGAGNDMLLSGGSADWLHGGAGTDTYAFTGSFGADWIADSDGLGRIVVDGVTIDGAGTRKLAEGVYSDGDWIYSLVANGSGGQDLILQRDSSLNTIRVRNWSPASNLGITLSDTAAAPVTTLTLAGDILKATNDSGTAYQTTANGYASAGVSPGAADVINGGAGDELIQGLGGNDGLDGGAGADVIEGGDGDDLILGGTGADTLDGGDGADYIYGSAVGGIARPSEVSSTPLAVDGVELARGFSWVAYRASGERFVGETAVMRHVGVAGAGLGVGLGDGTLMESTGNVIDGGAGNDYVAAGTGSDIVHGGEGDDDLNGMDGGDVLFGEAGADFIWGDGSADPNAFFSATYTPAEEHGNDVLSGGLDNDVLVGQGGDDQLHGGGDDDWLWGDDADLLDTPLAVHGADFLDGGDGADRLEGGGLDDRLFGGSGNDRLWGDHSNASVPAAHHGQDHLHGEDGDDQLIGGGNADVLIGGEGADTLLGDDELSFVAASAHGADYLDGGGGNDTMVGGGGGDVLYGGSENDVLWGDDNTTALSPADQGADYLDGGIGDDELSGGGGDDVLLGGEGADILVGDASQDHVDGAVHGDDELDGGAGDDLLAGTGGADTLRGGEGNDQLEGDTLVGHTGDIPAEFHGSDVLDGGAGHDRLYGGGAGDLLIGGTGDDWLAGEDQTSVAAESALTGDDDLYGGDGNDTLVGGNGADRLDGGNGDDYLVGGSGDDTLEAGAGADYLNGGEGVDTYVIDVAGDIDVIDDASSSNIVRLRGVNPDGVTVSQAWTGGAVNAGDSYLVLSANGTSVQIREGLRNGGNVYVFDDGSSMSQAELLARGFKPFFATAAAAGSLMHGGGGDDEFVGGAGNDTLFGGSGYDRLYGDSYGGTGSDLLDGGAGDDYLDGYGGDDMLLGGEGYDTLNGADGNDTLRVGPGGGYASGNQGNDIYLFERGDGLLTIDNRASDYLQALDVLRLGEGITAGEVSVFRSGVDLKLEIASAGDQVVLRRYFERADAYYRIGQMEFADGTVWSRATIEAAVMTDGSSGNDGLYGTPQDDAFHGRQGNDTIQGYGGNDRLWGDEGDDLLRGDAGNDMLDGGAGIDRLFADAGDDTLIDGEEMHGGTGSDTYIVNGWGREPTLHEGVGAGDHDVLILPEGSSPATVEVRRGYNSATQGYDDLYLKDKATGSYIVVPQYFRTQGGEYKIEEIRWSDGTVWGVADVFQHIVQTRPTEGDDFGILGFAWSDTIEGLGGNDSIDGLLGNDHLDGGAGNDTVYGSQGSDVVFGGAGNDTLFGDQYQTVTSPGDGNDVLNGGAGDDKLYGGGGNDVYHFDRAGGEDSVLDAGGIDRVVLGAGVTQQDVSLFRSDTLLTLSIDQSSTQMRLLGHFSGEANRIETIEFADGSFWDATAIEARAVRGTANAMVGTAGDDVFVVDDVGDTITEGFGQGIDQVQSSIGYSLGENLENLVLTGYLNLYANGNALANVITGNAGNNRLDGAGGADTLAGAQGDDTYFIDPREGDTVIERVSEGVDLVHSDWDYVLTDNVENLTATGRYARGYTLTGNGLDNVITGAAGRHNVLDGGAGADTLISPYGGGSTFYVDNVGDKIVSGTQDDHAGTDLVVSTIDWTLGDGTEALQLLGDADHGVGNREDNHLFGSEHHDLLEGLEGNDVFYAASSSHIELKPGVALTYSSTGADTLVGGSGDDTYYIDATDEGTDVVIELPEEGNDTVVIDGRVGSYELLSFAHVENAKLESSSYESNLSGTSAANRLTGNAYANVLAGGDGDDVLLDGAWQGPSANLSDVDRLLGGAGNDTLHSYYGGDWMDGGAGDDLLSVTGNGGRTISFGYGDGQDRLSSEGTSSATRVLFKAGVEATDLNLSREGLDLVFGFGSTPESITVERFFVEASSTRLAGNVGFIEFGDRTLLDAQQLVARLSAGNSNVATQGADVLIGSSSDDVLSGEAGDDSLFGRAGDDVLHGDDGNDSLYGGTGSDLMTGGAGADRIEGNEGADDLNGGRGNDVLQGGDGDDVYRFSHGDGSDTISDQGSGLDRLLLGVGIDAADLVLAREDGDLVVSISGTDDRITVQDFLNGGNVVDLVFSDATVWGAQTLTDMVTGIRGTSAADTLTGTDEEERLLGLGGNDSLAGLGGADQLDGGAGADTMSGGKGNDTYFVDHVSDVVRELSGQGYDQVFSSVSLTLSANVERLSLQGVSNINATGNGLANALIGNDGNNRLNGGSGSDYMAGGSGDDVYVVGSSGDRVVEDEDAGIDTVRSSTTHTLADHVENLILTGSYSIGGTGNASSNVLAGNSASNRLAGGSGDDIYIGGRGNDFITDSSTTSADAYLLGRGDGVDNVTDYGGAGDRIELGADISTDQLWFRRIGSGLEVSIIGTGDSMQVANWYSASGYRTEEFHTSDGKVLLESHVQNFVDAMAAFAPPAMGQTTLPSNHQSALASTIAANWQPAG